ncbi:MAG: metalloregulator ArsR/SmtB family transcription factor [Gemmatimonadales bacterium]|nr:metalloregulator ArsR/SmtB family transcription factor [Gemmatimonadales bacterium]
MTAPWKLPTFENMKVQNYEIFEIHASYCRALASSKRLAIMACLDRREMSVTELSECLEVPLSTVSRHLSVMKNKHLVTSRQEGTKVFYKPADKRIVEACQLIRTVLIDGMKRRGELALEINPLEIITDD